MDLPILIALVVLVFLVAAGGYYMARSLAGPRKLDDIDRLIKANRTREAIADLEKILEKDERNMGAHYRLGLCYSKRGEPSKGLIHLRRCLRIAKWTPDLREPRVRSLLAECLESSGNLTEAKNEYIILTTLEPNKFEHFFKAGELFFRAGVHNKALHFLQKATSLNPKHTDSLALLGQCHYHMQSFQEARTSLISATQLKADHYVAHYFLGLTLRYLGDLPWAVKELEKAEKDDAIKDKALLAKGMTLIDQESYQRAVQELDRALRYAKPGSDTLINVHYLLALAAERSRDLPVAIEHWEKCEAIKPGFRDVRDKLKQYSEFRTDDSIKDFMIASSAQFEGYSRKMVEKMGYQIANLKMRGDTVIEILASESDGRVGPRKTNTLFLIQRDVQAVHEKQVREFHEHMREENAARGVVMTTGDITPGALSFASSRPIELFDGASMAQKLKA
ncbi:MAG: tetratricopeptide repeat protein [Spirochaetales bacterium]|nr:tetratricopeptide repeat protein [Leptospiraceae bacterium]MCP5479889.1 tetratricopeptide repeat protein [Spirochaetales bacterium]MCP5486279.1 tetratricopeptide repeat protein [Spirochaetales bacterium]